MSGIEIDFRKNKKERLLCRTFLFLIIATCLPFPEEEKADGSFKLGEG